jgi:hypothetical protein
LQPSLALGSIAIASAQSLEARQMHAKSEADFQKQLELTNKACGTALTGSFNWDSFNADEAQSKGVMPWCQASLDAIEDLCSDPLGKQAVAEKIKTITCAGAATPSASLDNGALTFSFSLTPNQNKLLVRDYLSKHL